MSKYYEPNTFYQPYVLDSRGYVTFGEVYSDLRHAFTELKNEGHNIIGLRSRGEGTDFPIFDPNRNIGITLIKT